VAGRGAAVTLTYTQLATLDTDRLDVAARDWRAQAQAAEDLRAQVEHLVLAPLADGWRGPAATAARVGLPPAGLGLVGPGAPAAARGLLLAALTGRGEAAHTRVVIPAATLAALLHTTTVDAVDIADLSVATDLTDALALVETPSSPTAGSTPTRTPTRSQPCNPTAAACTSARHCCSSSTPPPSRRPSRPA
jgi:hypothetical protein